MVLLLSGVLMVSHLKTLSPAPQRVRFQERATAKPPRDTVWASRGWESHDLPDLFGLLPTRPSGCQGRHGASNEPEPLQVDEGRLGDSPLAISVPLQLFGFGVDWVSTKL